MENLIAATEACCWKTLVGLGEVLKGPVLRGIITYKINGMYFQILGEGADVFKLVYSDMAHQDSIFVTYVWNVMVFLFLHLLHK